MYAFDIEALAFRNKSTSVQAIVPCAPLVLYPRERLRFHHTVLVEGYSALQIKLLGEVEQIQFSAASGLVAFYPF